jgi:hypothetical protein
MSERSEFAALPLTGSGFWEPEGQPPRGRLFLGYLLFGEAKRSDRLPGRSRLGRGGVAPIQATPARKLDGQRSESASRVSVIFAIKPRKKTLTLVANDGGLRPHEKANRPPARSWRSNY